MAKLFTISEGLENLGALKTGGQGSVYKGKRTGEIISAVKLLPTPILSEDPSNKQYTDFMNEVMKLKRVNEEPNPNVVKILGSGITDTGGFPFIEMEFIEGPDLCDLLHPPHDKIFTIKETIRVAEHLSHALAHCHDRDVKHGDIKSNNVKFNRHTGNYVLLDFGLAVMSDEQRRTSLRNAGAIEFMAPEQNEGKMLFQTDVYSFGIIIFELLTGKVPFPLDSNSETARNRIMLSHMESEVPDLALLRQNNLPDAWSEEIKGRETQVPAWLSGMVYRCLEKQPSNRFENGRELYEYVCRHNSHSPGNEMQAGISTGEHYRLKREKEILHQQLQQQQEIAERSENEIAVLKNKLQHSSHSSHSGVSRVAFFALLFICVILASMAAYGLFFKDTGSVALSESFILVDSAAYHDSVEKAEEEKQRREWIARERPERKQEVETPVKEKDSANLDITQPPVDSTRNETRDSLPATGGDHSNSDAEQLSETIFNESN